MEAQVRNWLLQDDSPLRKDANFAFIYWNMIEKKGSQYKYHFLHPRVSAAEFSERTERCWSITDCIG